MTALGFQFSSVTKIYDRLPVLSEVSFTLDRGEDTAILGPSGCGKSTLLQLLAGLESPTDGTISLAGNVVSGPDLVLVPPHARGVSMLFQDLALWPNVSVLDNVLLGLSGLRLPKKEAGIRARTALALCSIDSLADARPGKISGGEQQRVALARALAPEPEFVLLDEPFSGLDLATKSRLLQDIRTLATEREITIVLVTHDPTEAAALCRGAIVLSEGRVGEVGSWMELLRNPRSEILRLFRNHLRSTTDGSGKGEAT